MELATGFKISIEAIYPPKADSGYREKVTVYEQQCDVDLDIPAVIAVVNGLMPKSSK